MRTVASLSLLLASCSPLAPEPPVNGTAGNPVAQPCLIQGDAPITDRLKAVGTEPFWATDVQGRCVTYSTPEDRAGTRIWTQVHSEGDGRIWEGAFGSRQFKLFVKPVAECSDGMSDRHYPLEAVLRVNGQTRRGCARWLATP